MDHSCLEGTAQRVVDLLNENEAHGWSLNEICHELGLSRSALQRALKTRYGLGYRGIVDRVRVHHVLALIQDEPSLKVDSLALSVGLRSRKSLYAVVRRVLGTSLQEICDRPHDASLRFKRLCRSAGRLASNLAARSIGT